MNAIAQKFVNALDRALGEPVQNMARQPRSAPVSPPTPPPNEWGTPAPPEHNLAPAIVANTPGSASAPMERTKVLPRPTPHELEGIPHASKAQFRAIVLAAKAEGFTVNPEIIERRQALLEPEQNLTAGLLRFDDAAARRDYQQHLPVVAQKIAKGEDTTSEDMWTLDSWLEDYRLRRGAIKAELKKIQAERRDIERPAWLAFSEAVTAVADRIEAELSQQAESFACAYQRPAFVAILRKTAADALATDAALNLSDLLTN